MESSKGNRSKVASFYCDFCDIIHVDYPIKKLIVLHMDNNLDVMCCTKSYEETIK